MNALPPAEPESSAVAVPANATVLQLPESARRVIVAVNPRAGARSRHDCVDQLVQLLERHGLMGEIQSSLPDLAREAEDSHARGELRAVVSAGGDGTIAELVNRLPAAIPLAVLPLGTENLLAKYIGQEPSPQSVCRTIVAGRAVRLDVGRANGRLFLLMLGVGFDAEVVRRMHEARAGHIRHWTWIKPIVATIRNYGYPELRIYWSSQPAGGPNHSAEDAVRSAEVVARWAFVTNLPRYARGLQFAPRAVGTDGLLDVCTLERGSLWDGVRYLWHVARHQHQQLDDCRLFRATRLRIEAAEPVPYQLDGDAGGWLPVEVSVEPQRLTLLVPEHFAP